MPASTRAVTVNAWSAPAAPPPHAAVHGEEEAGECQAQGRPYPTTHVQDPRGHPRLLRGNRAHDRGVVGRGEEAQAPTDERQQQQQPRRARSQQPHREQPYRGDPHPADRQSPGPDPVRDLAGERSDQPQRDGQSHELEPARAAPNPSPRDR